MLGTHFRGSARGAKLAALLILWLLVGVISKAEAQVETSKKIYVVDVQKIIDDSVMGKAALNEMRDIAKKREIGLLAKQKALKESQANLQKQAGLLSKSALEEKEQELVNEQKKFARMVEDEQAEMQQINSDRIGKIVADIESAVKELAKEKGAEMVLERDRKLVVYAGDKVDLTKEVINKLDQSKLAY